MIYEPKDVNGNIIDTKIEKSGDKYTEVVANLKFTCVKAVSYTHLSKQFILSAVLKS